MEKNDAMDKGELKRTERGDGKEGRDGQKGKGDDIMRQRRWKKSTGMEKRE